MKEATRDRFPVPALTVALLGSLLAAGCDLRAGPKPAPAPTTSPQPATPAPRLTPEVDGQDPASIAAKMALAEKLAASLESRAMTEPQKQQLTAARSLVVQARGALRDGDLRQADVLAEKGLILLRALDEATMSAPPA